MRNTPFTMKSLNILLSSAGRRVELMQCFRDALRDNNVIGSVYAADCSLTSSACYFADRSWQIPRCHEPEFIPALFGLALQEDIGLIIPTIDSELVTLAENKKLFAGRGITVCISSTETVRICSDKIATHEWLRQHGFPTVRQADPIVVLACPNDWPLPLIAKPRYGSASKGVRFITSFEELHAYAESTSDLIVQEIALGQEFTINVFVNLNGECVCEVPHRRLEVRGGEVSKAVTVKHKGMMTLAREIAGTLPDASGPLNIQCFLDGTDIRVIEINARAGGGYPLAHAAGAHFSHWVVREVLDRKPAAGYHAWTDDLLMLRYDQAVIQPASKFGASNLAAASVNGAGFR